MFFCAYVCVWCGNYITIFSHVKHLADCSRPDMEKQKILIIDHAPRVLSDLAGFLGGDSYDVFKAENGIEGLEILRREHIHLVVADRGTEEHDGIAFLEKLKADNIQTPVLIMGKVAPMELTEEILRAGAVSVVNKPVEKNRFLAKVETHIPSGGSWKIAFESFLEAHYSNPDLKFNDLVDHFKRSRSHLSALFKKHVGKPFREKLREIRIAHAQHLIGEQSLLTYEIASACGYRSSKYFCEVFMKVNDMSLTDYRNKMRCESLIQKNSSRVDLEAERGS